MANVKKCLGVDLGSSVVKVVEMAIEKTEVRVLKAVSAETGVEPTTSADDRRAAILKTLKELLKKNRIATKEAVFSIPSQKVFVRRFRLPMTNEERLQRIVQFEAREKIPFALDKTDLQYQFFNLPGDQEVEVLLVALRTDEVADFMGMVGKTGLTPIRVSITSFALFNGLSFLSLGKAKLQEKLESSKRKKKPKKGAAAATDSTAATETAEGGDEFAYEEVKGYLNIGASYFDLVVSRAGKVTLLGFSRTVPMAGNEISRSIMEKCQISSFADAERLKCHSTKLMTFDFDFEDDGTINRDACTAATQSVDRIITEVRRSLDFFITQPEGMAVDALVVSGGQSLLPGLDAYLEEKLTLPVTVARDMPENAPVTWPGDAPPVSSFMVALGLAAQGLGLGQVTIDFLPPEKKTIRDFPYRSVAVMGALLGGMALIASQAGTHYSQVFTQEAANIEAEKHKQEDQFSKKNEAQQLHGKVAGYFTGLAEPLGQRSFWTDFLADVAARKPPDILLDQVSLGHDGSIVIAGVSETQRSAADFSLDLGKMLSPTPAPGQKAGADNSSSRLSELTPLKDQRFPEREVFRFKVTLKNDAKKNHLRVTPTPIVAAKDAPAGAAPAAGGAPAAPQRTFVRPRR